MERDNKVLLGAVLILLVAMVSFNFTSLTGQSVTAESTFATVRATTEGGSTNVHFNERDLFGDDGQRQRLVNVEINVESGSIRNNLYLYKEGKESGSRTGRQVVISGCSGSVCPKGTYNVKFKVASDAGVLPDGNYFFRVINSRGQESNKKGFAITNFDSNKISISHYQSAQSAFGGSD